MNEVKFREILKNHSRQDRNDRNFADFSSYLSRIVGFIVRVLFVVIMKDLCAFIDA